MSGNLNNETMQELTFSDIFRILWEKKWWIIIVTATVSVGSVFYALSLPNLYKAETLLIPTESKSGLDPKLGGIAALAGVNIGSGDDNKSKVAIEIMQSRTFLGTFIERHSIAPALMAAELWDPKAGGIIYDKQIYDESLKKWFRTPTSALRTSEPSEQELVEAFRKMLEIVVEPSASLTKVSIEFISPVEASRWANLLVSEINEYMRKRDVDKAQRSIHYLQEQMNNSSLAAIRTSLSSAIEDQIKTLTTANVEEEYVFTTLDRAVAPEVKSSPKRALIVLMCTFLAALISIFSVLFFCLKNKTS